MTYIIHCKIYFHIARFLTLFLVTILSEKLIKFVVSYIKKQKLEEWNTFIEPPMTPRLATLNFSKCANLLVVLRSGYKYKGILAAYNKKKKVKYK